MAQLLVPYAVALMIVLANGGFALGALFLAEDAETVVVRVVFLVIAGTTGLIAVIASLVTLLSAFHLTNANHAFGLPAGTVRGTIALMLVVLFGTIAIALYFDLAAPLPEGEERSEQSVRFANQILTTVSTLVVAVAAFYFGTKAVAAAREPRTPEGTATAEGERVEQPGAVRIEAATMSPSAALSAAPSIRSVEEEEPLAAAGVIRLRIVGFALGAPPHSVALRGFVDGDTDPLAIDELEERQEIPADLIEVTEDGLIATFDRQDVVVAGTRWWVIVVRDDGEITAAAETVDIL